MRLAFFVDQVFWRDGNVVSTDEAYINFPASFADSGDEIVFLGRESPKPGRAPYVLDHPAISLCSLPYYPNLYQLWRANPRIYTCVRETVRQHARGWDAILICGPHPIGQMIARQCVALGVAVALVVRQNLVPQMSAHRGLKGRAAMTAARLLEWDFKRLARGRTVFTVGMELAEKYARVARSVHSHFPCLVDEVHYRMFSTMPAGSDPTRLLSVGRLSPEKGHEYLFEALVLLKARGILCHLDIVGTGGLEHHLRARAIELDLKPQVTFHGYIPYGSALFGLYQQAGALVLSSLTEGFPQVVTESLCVGLPTVATMVGGIPSFLTDGKTALLVPSRDVPALADAIERLVRDKDLRVRLRRNGRALMAKNTLEVHRARLIGALRDEILANR
jgi:glycosyltransferase involved in cell wall biosynthesis